MAKKSVSMQEQAMCIIFSEALKQCLNHNLKREDFYFISGKKKKEKRIDALTASKLLIEKTFLKNIRICLHSKTSYMYNPKGIWGPFSDNQVKLLISEVVGKVGEEDLKKIYYISQVLKALKSNPTITINGPFLFD